MTRRPALARGRLVPESGPERRGPTEKPACCPVAACLSGASMRRRDRVRRVTVGAVLLGSLFLAPIAAQQGGAPQAGPPPTPRAAAPIDLTGNWVSLVTNEWRWRMLTPPKGEYDVIPLNAAARKVADAWDPARDEAEGVQCRSYGAAVIMQVPGRLRIAWADDSTLRVETDAGQQTRLFRFGRPQPPGEATWQGHSVAEWVPARGQAREVNAEPRPARTGTLKVVTRGMRPGYLRRNGVPYGSDAVVTEYFTPFTGAGGTRYFNVQVVVEDPQYLTDVYVRSMQFRSEPDGSKWNPQPCAVR